MDAHAKVQAHLDQYDLGLKVIDLEEDTATAQLAAQALGVKVGQIAKSLLFKVGEEYVLVVAAGDVRIKANKLKAAAGGKAKMASFAEVEKVTGYPVGGVCPFALANPVRIFLDESLGQYDVVYTAAGTAHSALPITLDQLALITEGEIVNLT
ncbi:MAG: YbaK/EbsC family protein [Firmicutes bacterium]|nr:YbaK/EbsC family protein [Bacillota bacterium]